jgi:nucleotide-binding universal stress UspA family protein
MSGQRQGAPIVVGVDGSGLSIDALRWAVVQARLTGADVHAVTGWEVPFTIMIVPTYTEADYARDAHLVLDRAVAEVQETAPDVLIEKHLIQRRPALALTRAAEGAQLLVIGSHGRRAARHAPGLGRLLLRPSRTMPSGRRPRTRDRPLTRTRRTQPLYEDGGRGKGSV